MDFECSLPFCVIKLPKSSTWPTDYTRVLEAWYSSIKVPTIFQDISIRISKEAVMTGLSTLNYSVID